jgi:hypothetical protein
MVVEIFWKGLGKVEISAIFGGNPDVPRGVVNHERGILHETEVDPHLGKDETNGEYQSQQCYEKANFVIEKNPQGNIKHEIWNL